MTDNLLLNAAKLFGCTHMEDRRHDGGSVYFGYMADEEMFITLYRQRSVDNELLEFDYRENVQHMKYKPEPIP